MQRRIIFKTCLQRLLVKCSAIIVHIKKLYITVSLNYMFKIIFNELL